MRTALVSVSDKSGLTEFLKRIKAIKGLSDLRIIATRSTSQFLQKAGFDCVAIESITEFPEILGGRVKTLHPRVFAGILARGSKEDKAELSEHNISETDFVIVNLYPFEKKLLEGLSEPEMIENIDVGGVSLLRAAAKNFSRVLVSCDPDQYEKIAEELEAGKGETTHDFRRQLANDAFRRTADYDRAISAYLSNQIQQIQPEQKDLPELFAMHLAQYQPLRYGENPHQAAVWYGHGSHTTEAFGVENFPPFEQLQGKDLSSNNITDTYCLVRILRDIGTPACCIIKHNNPCGVAVGSTLDEAYEKAYSTDPVSAFGGIFGFTETVTSELASKVIEGFVEIVVAPDFDQSALDVFKAKKNVRVLKLKSSLLLPQRTTSWHLRDLQDFGWIMEKDVEPPVQAEQFQLVCGDPLKGEHIGDAAFSWSVVRHLTSNAIFIARNGKSLGFGIGQTSRIASVKIALAQAGGEAAGAVLASDAFFPATDNIDACAEAGISVIVQPGGSIKDKDVIEACSKRGITMLFTGQRCFKH